MRRRRFLRAGTVALGGVLGVTGRVDVVDATSRAFEPLGTLGIDGLSEVVVDESGTVAFGALRKGFVVVDVSDPADPTELARVTGILEDVENGPVHDVYDVKVSGDRLLVGGPRHAGGRDEARGFEIYDVSDPATPARVTGSPTDHGIHNGFIRGDTVFLTGTGASREPLVIYDASVDPAEEVARWSVEAADPAWKPVPTLYRTCHDVYVQGNVAHIAYWDAGTWLLDVSDPANPTAIAGIGGVPPGSLPRDAGSGFPPKLRELPGNSHYVQPSPDGTLLAVGKEAWNDDDTDRDGGPGGIEIWDRSDTANPTRLTVLAPPGEDHTSHNFGWRGNRLYTSWYGGGVRVFDLSDPESPSLLAEWADPETTSFWTAKPASEAIVASSYVDPRTGREERFDGIGATLYTFPEPGNSGVEAAATVTPRPTDPAVSAPTSTPAPTRNPTPTRTPGSTTDSRSTTRQPPRTAVDPTTTPRTNRPGDPDETTTETQDESAGGAAPGFGVLAALAAGGIAAWRLAAGRDRE